MDNKTDKEKAIILAMALWDVKKDQITIRENKRNCLGDKITSVEFWVEDESGVGNHYEMGKDHADLCDKFTKSMNLVIRRYQTAFSEIGCVPLHF